MQKLFRYQNEKLAQRTTGPEMVKVTTVMSFLGEEHAKMGFRESLFFKMAKKFFSKASFTEGPKKTTSQRRLSPSRFWPDTSKKSGIGSCKEIKGQDGVGEVAYLGSWGLEATMTEMWRNDQGI